MAGVKVEGIKELQTKLTRMQSDLAPGGKIKTFLEKLGSYGVNVAQATFNDFDYPGDNDVVVSKEIEGNKLTIYAKGENVLYIEFGTGPANKEHFGQHADEFGFYPLSASHGKVHLPEGYWFYSGNPGKGGRAHHAYNHYKGSYITYGNPGADVMPKTKDEVIDYILQAFDEVFKGD